MTTDSPITPPPELVQQWVAEIWHEGTPVRVSLSDEHIATRAAQWGADQELEACRMEIIDGAGLFYIDETSDRVRLAEDIWTARRPKPPSLKEQALKELQMAYDTSDISVVHLDTIRRALEALPE